MFLVLHLFIIKAPGLGKKTHRGKAYVRRAIDK